MTMRVLSWLVPVAFLAAGPARLATTWEKLEHGVDVVRECASDIRKNCGGVEPGDGRIKACAAAHLADLSSACLTALATPKPEVLSDGAHAKTMRIDNSHLMRFIEMYLAGIDPTSGDIVAECDGTYANPNVPATKNSAPQTLVADLNMQQIEQHTAFWAHH